MTRSGIIDALRFIIDWEGPHRAFKFANGLVHPFQLVKTRQALVLTIIVWSRAFRMNTIFPKTLFTSARLQGFSSHIRYRRTPFFLFIEGRQFAMAATKDYTNVPSDGSIPAYSFFNKPIEKSLQDDREYRIILLENGLSATIVHDPNADKAAASLDVSVGHLSDPVSFSLRCISVG